MELKKCDRCGCFFISEDSVCCNCMRKDRLDFMKLQSYIDENGALGSSFEEISAQTGITIKNLSRFGEIKPIDGLPDKTEFKPFGNIIL